MMGVIERLVAERFEKDAEPRKDMIGSLIRHGLAKENIEEETMLQVASGTDTTASAIRGIMLYVMATPRVYKRLKAEIAQAIEQKQVSSPITYTEALKLPYLQAVIWEGYRTKPSVAYGFYKLVPPGGETINGLFIPGGTAIGNNFLAMTRKESIFGRDVDVFRPERFLECSEAKKLEMNRALDMAFGGGRWMCPGKTVALIELNKVIFELLRAFDFQVIYPGSPWKEITRLGVSHTDMMVRITEAVL